MFSVSFFPSILPSHSTLLSLIIFRKYPYTPSLPEGIENSRGWGLLRANKFKEISSRLGDLRKKSLVGGGGGSMVVFWNRTIEVKCNDDEGDKRNVCVLFQTGLSGNVIMLSVLYSGGMMMTDAQISVGDLTSFLLYAGFVGISFGGKKNL